MKKVYITLIMAFIAISAIAQNRPHQERGFMGANPAILEPQMSVEQQEAISKLKFELKKELLSVNNQIAEKEIQLRSLQQVEKPKMKDINSKIDEITNLQNKKMKIVANHRVEVRKHLTEEQRLAYDLRMNSRRKGVKRGVKNFKGARNNGRGDMDRRGDMSRRGDMNHKGVRNSKEGLNSGNGKNS